MQTVSGRLTLEERRRLEHVDGSSGRILAGSEFDEEDGQTDEDEGQHVRDEEGACSNMDGVQAGHTLSQLLQEDGVQAGHTLSQLI